MLLDDTAARLGLALAIGLLVGLERGWRERDQPDHSRTAGIRTYGISGLLGGLLALLSQAFASVAVFVAGFVVFAAVLSLYKLREAVAENDFSATAVIAGLAVFALGALAVAGDYRLAVGGGAALPAVLASREVLHGFLRRLTWEELRAALILAVMTAIVLPVLPDRTVDPWNGVNPREIWLFTILVASLSFAGYVATRVLGHGRGLLLTTLLGALVSSTAVTVALARRSKEVPASLAGAAALAAAVSVTRVCLIVAVTAPALLIGIGPPALAAIVVFATAGSLMLLRAADPMADGMPLKNPFELAPLLAFAASFAVIAGASAFLTQWLGATGMLATSALSGTFDVDVAVLSAVRQLGRTAGSMDVERAVLLALLANAGGRAFLAALAGSLAFSARYLSTTAAAIGAAAIVHLLLAAGPTP
jgi:uncharacterized membrane protein (DUF4010 family)